MGMTSSRLVSALRDGWLGMMALLLITASASAQDQGKDPKESARAHYQHVPNWPVLPAGVSVGAVAGVGVDSHDNVFVFHRAARDWPASGVLDLKPIDEPTIAVFDGRSGALL